MNTNKQLVAVYGSLKKGYGNHTLLTNSKLIGTVVTEPEFTMYSCGAYPAIVNGDEAIHCELYEVDEQTMDNLDRLEGFPTFYNRKQVPLSNGAKAWIYYIELDKHSDWVAGLPKVEGGSW